MRKTLLALLLLTGGALAQAQVELRDGHPERYTVVKGDTLWDISARFLNLPWKWPQIWHVNPQVENPHLIYPGDVLSLVYVDGQPRLTLERGASRGTVKLSPQMRSTPMVEAIAPIPLEAINSFLLANRIVDSADEFERAPYIVAGNAERVISGKDDRVYARGRFPNEEPVYGIYRQGRTYVDPVTREVLGINADDIGTGQRIGEEGDITTLRLSRSTQEIRSADRLFSTEERALTSSFMPSEPLQTVDGLILDVPRGVTQIGLYDVVTLNKGRRDGVSEGNVLAIYKTGETVRDRLTGEQVKIPDERAGLLMVFRSYDKLSYGLILQATRQMAVLDKVRNP